MSLNKVFARVSCIARRKARQSCIAKPSPPFKNPSTNPPRSPPKRIPNSVPIQEAGMEMEMGMDMNIVYIEVNG